MTVPLGYPQYEAEAAKGIPKWAVTPSPYAPRHACFIATPLSLLSMWLQETHLLFVLAAANLYAQMHGLPGCRDQIALKALLKSLPQPDPQLLAPGPGMAPELAWAPAKSG